MSTSSKFLDEAFETALSNASTLDQQGMIPQDTEEFFPGGPPTNVQLVQECLDFYNQHHAVMDRAIKGALDLLSTPEGVSKVKALEAAFDTSGNDSRNLELTSELLSDGQFGLTNVAEAQALTGFGIGASAGVSDPNRGYFAGADIVFEADDTIPRVWVGHSLHGDLSASAGLELSFWVTTPYRGPIKGWILDLHLVHFLTGYFIRLMYIRQPPIGERTMPFAGVSLQFPYGTGLPLWLYYLIVKGELRFTAHYRAWQHAKGRTQWSTAFEVLNKVGGTATINYQQNTTLVCTVKNTSSENIPLGVGTVINLVMPSYFTTTDVTKMGVSLPGWTFTTNNNRLILTATAATTVNAGATFTIDITNVESSSTPPVDAPAILGKVEFLLTNPSYDLPLHNSAEFDLVWPPVSLYLVWKTGLGPQPNYNINAPTSGSQEVSATPSTQVMMLTTATEISNGDSWVLGYVFQYNANLQPEVGAAWFDKNTGQKLTYNWATASGQSTSCSNTDGSYILITVTF